MTISNEIRAAQEAYAARPFAVRWRDSHFSGTTRFHTFDGAKERVQNTRGWLETRDVYVVFADAPVNYQREAVQQLIYTKQGIAREAAWIATGILERADTITGKQELRARAADTKIQIVAGTRVRLFGKTGIEVTVKDVRGAVARGCGPYMNGNYMDHIVYERDGKEYLYPVRLIRQSAIVAQVQS